MGAPPPVFRGAGFTPYPVPNDPAAGNTAANPLPTLPRLVLAPVASIGLEPVCAGAYARGGLMVCQTLPGTTVTIGEAAQTTADAEGLVVVGFDRDAPAEETITFTRDGQTYAMTVQISGRAFNEQVINGLPQNTVTPNAEAQARIARDRVLINQGYASRADGDGFLEGFIWPVEGRISAAWGARRIVNGTPARPHYGIDIAVPTGTPIRAPASGVVSLAQPDLHQEGGLVMIDHGQGLITLYLHMSRIDVAAGQMVAQGDVIGAVGATGRATGPHLCWRMKWRDRYLDPSLAILGLANARGALSLAP
jgi:murein DD-endopeptidase MepM/ murein hydrolase activator NlpD